MNSKPMCCLDVDVIGPKNQMACEDETKKWNEKSATQIPTLYPKQPKA